VVSLRRGHRLRPCISQLACTHSPVRKLTKVSGWLSAVIVPNDGPIVTSRLDDTSPSH
jgi:hypothetical protein